MNAAKAIARRFLILTARRGMYLAVAALAFMVVDMHTNDADFGGSRDMEVSPYSKIESMINDGDCWTGAAPADMEGKIPGHVWVNNTYRGERAVGKALEQLFDGVDHGLTVNAFCR